MSSAVLPAIELASPAILVFLLPPFGAALLWLASLRHLLLLLPNAADLRHDALPDRRLVVQEARVSVPAIPVVARVHEDAAHRQLEGAPVAGNQRAHGSFVSFGSFVSVWLSKAG